jgi:hypothetical protein
MVQCGAVEGIQVVFYKNENGKKRAFELRFALILFYRHTVRQKACEHLLKECYCLVQRPCGWRARGIRFGFTNAHFHSYSLLFKNITSLLMKTRKSTSYKVTCWCNNLDRSWQSMQWLCDILLTN